MLGSVINMTREGLQYGQPVEQNYAGPTISIRDA